MGFLQNYIFNTLRSFRHAFRGIGYVLVHHPSTNIPNYYVFTLAVIILSVYFRINYFEAFILFFMALFVICAEMVNTAIEELANLVKKEHSGEVKIAKDVSAGMVAMATIVYVGLAVVVFGYHLILVSR